MEWNERPKEGKWACLPACLPACPPRHSQRAAARPAAPAWSVSVGARLHHALCLLRRRQDGLPPSTTLPGKFIPENVWLNADRRGTGSTQPFRCQFVRIHIEIHKMRCERERWRAERREEREEAVYKSGHGSGISPTKYGATSRRSLSVTKQFCTVWWFVLRLHRGIGAGEIKVRFVSIHSAD